MSQTSDPTAPLLSSIGEIEAGTSRANSPARKPGLARPSFSAPIALLAQHKKTPEQLEVRDKMRGVR